MYVQFWLFTNLIKIWSLIAPGYVALYAQHNKTGAIKGWILIRLTVYHQMNNIIVSGIWQKYLAYIG